MLSAVCPGCGVRADDLPVHFAGKTLRCAKCGTRFAVTEAAPAATAWEDAPAPPAATAWEDAPAPPAPAPPLATRWEDSPPVPGAPAATEHEDDAASAPVVPPRPPSVPSSTTTIADWRVGQVVLDLYEVTGVLGQGGMGRVYKVRHRGWDVELAVKAPLASVLQLVGGAENFEREAETWVGLGLHPNVVACYYVRRVDGVPRVFAELVDGGSLSDAIRRRRLTSLDTLLDVAIQFAWGLHYAHEQGLVHRDVKPANVMLGSDGVAKVTDFGLARARAMVALAGGGAGQTMVVAGGGGGTPAYMSPEQSSGATLTRRTDLWSWAVSVLEMFKGERSWDYGVAAAEVLREYLELGGKSVGLPAMPRAVADLLARCFRDDPEARPRTLWEAATALYGPYEVAAGMAYPRTEPQAGRDTADSLNNRGASLLDLGREQEAETMWARALRDDPTHLETTCNAAVRQWARGLIADDDLANRVEAARQAHAGEPRAHQLAARVLFAAGDPGRAVAALEQAAAASPATSVELDRELGLALCARGGDEASWKRARQCLENTLQAGQETTVEVVAHVLTVDRLGERDEAARAWERVSAERPELPRALPDAVAALVPGHEARHLLRGLARAAVTMAVSPDGRTVVAGEGGVLRIWGAGATRTIDVKDAVTRAITFLPDGATLLWAGEKAPLQQLDLATGRVLRTFAPTPGLTTCVAVSRDGTLAVTGGSDRVVRAWDLATGRVLHAFEGHTEAVTCVTVTDGGLAASGSLDGTVRMWPLAAAEDRTVRGWEAASGAVLSDHKGRVSALAAAGPLLVSGGEDRLVRVWSLQTGALQRRLAGHTQPITAVAFAGKGMALSAAHDRMLRVWDVGGAKLHAVIRLEVAALALGAGGAGAAWAAAGTTVLGVRLPARPRIPPTAVSRPVSASEAEQREVTFQGRVDEAQRTLLAGDLPAAVELARTARSIPGYERSESAIALWDEVCSVLPRKGLQGTWVDAELDGHRDPVLAVAVSGDGARVLSGGMDHALRLWDVRSRQSLGVLEGHEQAVTAAAFGPDGRLAVSCSWDHTAAVWDLATLSLQRRLQGHEDYVNALALSPDGGTVATASRDRTLRLFDVEGHGTPRVLSGHDGNVSAVAYSPDGRFVVSGAWDQRLRAWDVATGESACVLEGHEDNVSTVAISANGRQLASGGADNTVRLWDLRARRTLRTLAGHTAEVTSVAFSPDGRYLASGSRDKSVRVWDLTSGQSVRSLDHTAAVMSVAFTPAGNALVTGGADRLVRVWHLDWEPEARALPPWDDKARPYLETFVSLRLKPVTVKAATVRPSLTDGDLDALVTDLRHRGFGGLSRATVAARLQDLTQQAGPSTSYWDEVKRAAPRGHAPAVRDVARKVPVRRVAAISALALLFVAGVLSWLTWTDDLRLVQKRIDDTKRAVYVIPLAKFGEPCPGGYAEALQAAREREVSAPVLACLARATGGNVADDYLEGFTLDDPDVEWVQRARRNAVSLLVSLGPTSVDTVCSHAGGSNAHAREVAATALGVMATNESIGCLTRLAAADPPARLAAASALKFVIASGVLSPQQSYDLVERLLRDSDPQVRARTLDVADFFNPDWADKLVDHARKDPDPAVRAAAEGQARNVAGQRKLDELDGR